MRSGLDAVVRSGAPQDVATSVPLGWALALLAYAVLLYANILSARATLWLTYFAWTAASLIAALATWRTSRRLTGKRRIAWTLFALACFGWFLGQVAWDWDQLVQRQSSAPGAADYGYTAFGLLFIAGLYYLSATQSARKLNPQRAANLGLIVCMLMVVLIAMVLEPALRTPAPDFVVAISVFEALAVTAAFVVAIYFLWSYNWDTDLLPLILLAAALFVHAIAGLLHANTLIADRFDSSRLLDVAWIAAFGLQHWAAVEQAHVEARRAAHIDRWEGHGWIEALVPSSLLLFIAVIAIAFVEDLSPRAIVLNAALLAVFALLLAFREVWLHSRGLLLKTRLQRSNTQLESAREQLRRSSDELLEMERNTRFTARAGGVGLWDWDLRTDRIHYSPEWKGQLGYEELELSDDPQEWRTRLHPDDAESVNASLQRYLEHPAGEYTAELRLRHRDGSYRWFLGRGTVHLDRHGVPVRMLGVQLDITERKQFEGALRDSEARYRELAAVLEQRVAERTADLQEAYREARSFSYAVAHDLKAPLRAIDSFSHLLYDSRGSNLTPAEQDYVRRLRRAAMRMASLIDGLLDYSRMEHREVHLGDLELCDFVSELVAHRQEEITARSVEVATAVPAVLSVRADREGLEVVLRNLLDNALKFTSTVPRAQIEIGARRERHSAVLWVKDNGIGFEQTYHDQIFEIFQRLHRTEEYEGTGIGLALARKATQRMRGRIWAESRLGSGATFFVELPLSYDLER